MIRRLLATLVVAIIVPATVAPIALAECMSSPMRATDRLEAAYAFTATVAEASREVDPPKPDNAPFDWHVELDVDRVYRGELPERLVFNGWDAGCHRLLGDRLRAGDRLFVVSNVFRPDPSHVDPFWTMDAQVLAWKGADDGWEFYADVLDSGSDPGFYPGAARRATTTAEIVRLVSAAPLPDTATAPVASPDGEPWHMPIVALASVVGFIAVLWRRRPVTPF